MNSHRNTVLVIFIVICFFSFAKWTFALTYADLNTDYTESGGLGSSAIFNGSDSGIWTVRYDDDANPANSSAGEGVLTLQNDLGDGAVRVTGFAGIGPLGTLGIGNFPMLADDAAFDGRTLPADTLMVHPGGHVGHITTSPYLVIQYEATVALTDILVNYSVQVPGGGSIRFKILDSAGTSLLSLTPVTAGNPASGSLPVSSLSAGQRIYVVVDCETDNPYGDQTWLTLLIEKDVPKADLVAPAQDSVSVLPDTSLEWTPVAASDSQSVYMGTDADSLALLAALTGDANSFDLDSPMALNTEYFWRVDTRVGSETFSGDLWHFTTHPGLDPDVNNDGIVNLGDFSAVAAEWLKGNCPDEQPFCGGADLNLSRTVDGDDFEILGGNWLVRSVTFGTLLDEMIDRDELAKKPLYAYTLGQASSYDRASTTPDGPGWYANADGGGYIRTEINDGRTERVLMDETGSGAIVRYWSTNLTWTFTNGTLRFYFDGASTPQIEGSFLDILNGTHLVDGVLATATGGFYENEHMLTGYNLYLPLPYTNGCKVTYEGTDNPFYFVINYRKYSEGTPVKTFSMPDLQQYQAKLAAVQEELTQNTSVTEGADLLSAYDATIAAGDSLLLPISSSGPKAIRQLMVNIDAADYKQALRSTVLEIEFDDMQKVWSPLGDFFGTGYALAADYESRYHKVSWDGRMLCRWIMPFQSNAKIRIRNYGTQAVMLKELEVHHTSWQWDDRSLYFHAGWRLYSQIPTRPQRDINYVTIQGQGKYIGDTLTIFNDVTGSEGQPWWGEGDEKIYVDGEAFPSNFGTGTEDYYGFAWVGCSVFSQPFLAQPSAQGNRGKGMTVNSRWRSLDTIPFQQSLKLDMEIWHWVTNRTLDYAPTTFWYGISGTRPVVDLDAQPVVAQPADLAGVQTAVNVVDRFEAEAMRVVDGSAGIAQTYTYPNETAFSNRTYMRLRNLSTDDTVTLQFYSDKETTGTLEVACVKSNQSMVMDLSVNGQPLLQGENMYNGTLLVSKYSIPNIAINKGINTLTVKAKGPSPENSASNELGIDYLSFGL